MVRGRSSSGRGRRRGCQHLPSSRQRGGRRAGVVRGRSSPTRTSDGRGSRLCRVRKNTRWPSRRFILPTRFVVASSPAGVVQVFLASSPPSGFFSMQPPPAFPDSTYSRGFSTFGIALFGLLRTTIFWDDHPGLKTRSVQVSKPGWTRSSVQVSNYFLRPGLKARLDAFLRPGLKLFPPSRSQSPVGRVEGDRGSREQKV